MVAFKKKVLKYGTPKPRFSEAHPLKIRAYGFRAIRASGGIDEASLVVF